MKKKAVINKKVRGLATALRKTFSASICGRGKQY